MFCIPHVARQNEVIRYTEIFSIHNMDIILGVFPERLYAQGC